jgi:uracil DNA glycosylase
MSYKLDKKTIKNLDNWNLLPILQKHLNIKAFLDTNPRICPKRENIFNAFDFDPSKLKVVMIGQDPYPNPTLATGIAFGVPKAEWSKSLDIIEDELAYYLGRIDLEKSLDETMHKWKDEGILMINAALTTEKYKTRSHTKLWRPFLLDLIKQLDTSYSDITFVFLGTDAKSLDVVKNNDKIIKPHPMVDQYGGKVKFRTTYGDKNNLFKLLEKHSIEWI